MHNSFEAKRGVFSGCGKAVKGRGVSLRSSSIHGHRESVCVWYIVEIGR